MKLKIKYTFTYGKLTYIVAVLLATIIFFFLSLVRSKDDGTFPSEQYLPVDLDTLINNQSDFDKNHIKTSGYLKTRIIYPSVSPFGIGLIASLVIEYSKYRGVPVL